MTRGIPRRLAAVCVFAVVCNGGLAGQTPASQSLSIRVLEGDGALNDVRLRRGHNPVVQVVNGEGRPVEGANVTFLLPSTGASGSFGDSGSSLTVRSDAKGMAAGRG